MSVRVPEIDEDSGDLDASGQSRLYPDAARTGERLDVYLANALPNFSRNYIQQLIAGGSRPDMVQIGNESTPGILIHKCDSGGRPYAGTAGYNAVNGAIYLYSSTDGGAPPAGGPAAGGWGNLGMLLSAGVKGVMLLRQIYP